ncbi:DNA cytosine methyltransferase [Burkholderia thailandensis]|uniref:DNA cytosine methyltransferase n=1 Tax=Burkholderia thailandensis TaxID=57975 RepID=UPI00016A6F50|nr:DNA cytosine methyltransferase [Burkholderia thailandensis]AIS95175.1 DNA (cytosine-5-)-methyltransferase family protein [Burkholderia thailandensis MSMB59]AOJ43628.1 DNA cytosine methyltransferase [Burkholderia thailandensis]KVG14556.1 DNA cytosine methyltransferase [Burkholderia thailandensis]
MSRNSSSSVKSPRIVGVDLFCGVGGLTHGLVRGGIQVSAGIDIDTSCKFPFEANNSAVFLERDVGKLKAEEIAPFYEGADITLLAGCAPCQPFSTYSQSGRNRFYESQWPLVLAFGRLIRKTKPDLVTMENVPQLADHPVFQQFLKGLVGYKKWWQVVECSSIGVPQTRKRLVLLASRLGSEGLELSRERVQRTTVRETIGALPPIKAGERDPKDELHAAPSLSALNMSRIRASRPGGTWRDWPDELLASCHRKDTGATYPSVYGRMEWDEPAPTITTQCFGYGNGRFGHPEQDRAISLREAAMLQTFPKSYAFTPPGSSIKFNKMGRLIGNAVPVRLGEVIARSLVAHVQAHVR